MQRCYSVVGVAEESFEERGLFLIPFLGEAAPNPFNFFLCVLPCGKPLLYETLRERVYASFSNKTLANAVACGKPSGFGGDAPNVANAIDGNRLGAASRREDCDPLTALRLRFSSLYLNMV
jgi:hypothetical protein